MKILIFDAIHGGEFIADRLVSRGDEVTCVDVYRYAKEDVKERIRSMGARITETAPEGHYDLLVAPAHCPIGLFTPEGVTIDRIMTFSEMVGELITDSRKRIEITGVKGKTSLSYLTAHILDACGKKVFLHTSRGQGQYIGGKHEITSLMSIAPTSLLVLPEGDYDIMVTEVSLGGSGKADIAVITNLLEDYPIAKGTKKASDAKKSILTDGINIVEQSEKEFWSRYSKGKLVTYGGNVKVASYEGLGVPMRLEIDYMGKSHSISFGEGFLAMEYIHAIEAALTISEQLGLPADGVITAIESFKGIPGRGEITKRGDKWTITERNPGISHISIGNTLRCLKEMNVLDSDTVAILDPVNRRVCDKLDIEPIKDTFRRFGVKLIMLNGVDHEIRVPDDAGLALIFIKEGFA